MNTPHTATRLITAAPPAVYRALSDPLALMQWLPPQGATGRIDAFELRPGGRFVMTLTFDAHPGKSTVDSDVVNGRFVDVVPEDRLVMTFIFQSEDPDFAGEMTMTWRLAAEDGGTRLTMVADNVPRGISQQDHEEGLASSLDNLARLMKANPQTT